ncbi:MAG: hypothetical protein ACRDF0_06965 [Candidatus Limnocylindria bacterium]
MTHALRIAARAAVRCPGRVAEIIRRATRAITASADVALTERLGARLLTADGAPRAVSEARGVDVALA